MQEHIFFQGILQKRAGNFTLKASWHDRYFILATVLLRTSSDPRGETIRTTGLFYFEIEDENPFSVASMQAPVQGYFDLAFYCNVKTRTGKDADYRYLTLIRDPDQDPDDLKELRIRSLKTNRNGCRQLNAFRDVCIEHVRQCNKSSRDYQRVFDGELFSDPSSPVGTYVPADLVAYGEHWLSTRANPTGEGGHLLSYLHQQLDWVLESTGGPDDLQCIQKAKSVTGILAAAARAIFRQEEEAEPWGRQFRVCQTLQEYQVRQLVELAVFKQEGDKDRSMHAFVAWVRGSQNVAEMQARIDEKLPRFGSSERYMQLDDFWAKKLRQERQGFETLQSLYGLLTPSLQMVCAMQVCTTPVQKVRLWAEAIVEAISLINAQFPSSEPSQPEELQQNAIGGPDIPSLVLFLTCTNECKELYVEAKLARLFCLDNYGEDAKEFGLVPGGLYTDLAEQYAFQAEKRSIDHAHYLLWVEDTLRIVAETVLTPKQGSAQPSRGELDELSLEGLPAPPQPTTAENLLPLELSLDFLESPEPVRVEPQFLVLPEPNEPDLLQPALELLQGHEAEPPEPTPDRPKPQPLISAVSRDSVPEASPMLLTEDNDDLLIEHVTQMNSTIYRD